MGAKMQLIRTTKNFAILRDGKRIIVKPLNPLARKVLDWNNRNIPAND